MKILPSTARGPSTHGYVMYFVLVSLAVLSMVAGQIILRVRDSYRAIHRAANWQQALTTADAGVDIAISQLTSALPDLRVNSEETVGLSAPQDFLGALDLGITLPAGNSSLPLHLSATLTPPPLVVSGEGNTTQQAKVAIEVVPVDAAPGALLSAATGELTLQVVRVRSTGIAYLDSSRSAGYEKAENDLRRPILVWDRQARQDVDRPYVARTVEATLRPALPFEAGVVSLGEFRVDSDDAVFDSFNSLLPAASTLGRYDAGKRLQNTTVQTNSADPTLAGYVYGNVFTNGGNLQKTDHISGSVANDHYRSVPPLRSPAWHGNSGAPAAITQPTTLDAGSVALPARYQFTGVSSTLHITRGLLGLGTNVDILVTGDFSGKLIVDDGIRARVYIQGDVAAGVGAWQNGSHRASNLQIYGLKPASGKGSMTFSLSSDMEATIYAPEHSIVFTDNGEFSGSVTGGSVRIKDAAKLHYDEALALNVGPIVGFALVSWREILPE